MSGGPAAVRRRPPCDKGGKIEFIDQRDPPSSTFIPCRRRPCPHVRCNNMESGRTEPMNHCMFARGRHLEHYSFIFFYINILMKWKYQRKRLRNASGTQCFSLFASWRHTWVLTCGGQWSTQSTRLTFSSVRPSLAGKKQNKNSSLSLAENLLKAAVQL